MLLAILGTAVQCLWSLSAYEEAMIATVVFVGMMLGSPVWGFLQVNYSILFYKIVSYYLAGPCIIYVTKLTFSVPFIPHHLAELVITDVFIK